MELTNTNTKNEVWKLTIVSAYGNTERILSEERVTLSQIGSILHGRNFLITALLIFKDYAFWLSAFACEIAFAQRMERGETILFNTEKETVARV